MRTVRSRYILRSLKVVCWMCPLDVWAMVRIFSSMLRMAQTLRNGHSGNSKVCSTVFWWAISRRNTVELQDMLRDVTACIWEDQCSVIITSLSQCHYFAFSYLYSALHRWHLSATHSRHLDCYQFWGYSNKSQIIVQNRGTINKGVIISQTHHILQKATITHQIKIKVYI